MKEFMDAEIELILLEGADEIWTDVIETSDGEGGDLEDDEWE